MSDAELEAALAALASDDDEQALERLVAAWGTCRAAALVPLVDTLASRIEPREKALAGKTANDRYEAFRATAMRTRQADLARLVALLPKLAYGDLATALDVLLYQWPHTPRMRALLESVRLPGYGDRIEELRVVHAQPRADELSDRARTVIAELDRLLRADDPAGEALLAQVYADPSADAPRLVYADWATSRGDPRGELISLQFARRDRTPDASAIRRERALLEQYMHRWLAPIWNAIRPYSVRFERGFLAAVTVEPFAVIAPRPEWSTVSALELAYHEALPMDAFPALRELRNVTPRLLAQIAAHPTKLTHVTLAEEPGGRTAPKMVELADAFPDLRSLGVWGRRPEDWAWVWNTRLGAQLEAIELTRQFPGDTPWLTMPLPRNIREIHVRERSDEARFVRDGDTFPKLEVYCREATRDLYTWIHMLGLVPERTLREVRFVAPRKPKPDLAERIERETRRLHPTLERFTLHVDPFI